MAPGLLSTGPPRPSLPPRPALRPDQLSPRLVPPSGGSFSAAAWPQGMTPAEARLGMGRRKEGEMPPWLRGSTPYTQEPFWGPDQMAASAQAGLPPSGARSAAAHTWVVAAARGHPTPSTTRPMALGSAGHPKAPQPSAARSLSSGLHCSSSFAQLWPRALPAPPALRPPHYRGFQTHRNSRSPRPLSSAGPRAGFPWASPRRV